MRGKVNWANKVLSIEVHTMSLVEAEARDPTAQRAIHDVALEKDEHDHYDNAIDKSGHDIESIPVSPFRDMKRSKALRVFWRVALYAILAAWAAIMDGFLITSELVSAPM